MRSVEVRVVIPGAVYEPPRSLTKQILLSRQRIEMRLTRDRRGVTARGMISKGAEDQVRRVLEGKSPVQVRAMCIEALKRWHKGETRGQPRERRIVSTPLGHPQPDDTPTDRRFQMHGDLGVLVLRAHSEATGEAILSDAKEVFLEGQNLPFMEPVMEFVWWMVRAGVARPELGQQILGGLYVTDAGLKFLGSAGDHPLHPGFLDRLRKRFQDMDEEVLVLFEDARACLGFRLLRPAVVLLGVAYEKAIEEVLLHFVPLGLTSAKSVQAAHANERIATLKKLLSKLDMSKDGARMATAAIDFADNLRVRRNDGSHTTPRWPFDDSSEVEELILTASRYLPALWLVKNATPRPPS